MWRKAIHILAVTALVVTGLGLPTAAWPTASAADEPYIAEMFVVLNNNKMQDYIMVVDPSNNMTKAQCESFKGTTKDKTLITQFEQKDKGATCSILQTFTSYKASSQFSRQNGKTTVTVDPQATINVSAKPLGISSATFRALIVGVEGKVVSAPGNVKLQYEVFNKRNLHMAYWRNPSAAVTMEFTLTSDDGTQKQDPFSLLPDNKTASPSDSPSDTPSASASPTSNANPLETAAPTQSAAAAGSEGEDGSNTTALYAALGVGIVVLLALLALIVMVLRKPRKGAKSSGSYPNNTSGYVPTMASGQINTSGPLQGTQGIQGTQGASAASAAYASSTASAAYPQSAASAAPAPTQSARAPRNTRHQAPLRPQRAMRNRQPQGMHSQRRRAMPPRRRRPLTPPAHHKATDRAPHPRVTASQQLPKVTGSSPRRATGNRPPPKGRGNRRRKATANPRATTRALRKPMGKALSSRCSPVTPRKRPWPQLTATRRTPSRPLPRPLHRTRFRRPSRKKPCRRLPRSLRKRRFRPQLRTMTLPLPRFMTRIASQTSSPALAGTTSLMAAN